MEDVRSTEAEASVIASCLSNEDTLTYDSIAKIINKNDFYEYRYALLFQAIGELINASKEVNEITLTEKLRKDNNLDSVGGMPAIFAIMDSPSTPLAGRESAKIVLEHSRTRQLNRTYRLKLEELAEGGDLTEIASTTETALRNIMSDNSVANSLEDASKNLKDRLHSIINGTYESNKIPTGIDHLDLKLDEGGIGLGEVFVIGAPTSCGKSQLALNLVLRSSITDDVPSLIFSFEMPANQLTKRMAQTTSAVNLRRYVDKVATKEEMKAVDDAIDKIGKAPIYTEHSVRSVDELRSKARIMKRKHGIKLIVIDYLQLVPYDSKLSKHEGISKVSHAIKQMAMELDVAVILLAQINRTGAMRESGLVLYDLKDSGDIENDADIVLLMSPNGGDIDHCRRHLDNGVTYLEMDYNVAKNREGERDLKGKFKFLNHIGRFQ
tara:strand:+ start:6657 stop:7970 length:1314 start_codon:yes stop_codon:yes gene_type:complete